MNNTHSNDVSPLIFISHSGKDAPVVEAFSDMIKHVLSLKEENLVCTSLLEQSIPNGIDYNDYLSIKINKADIVIILLSPNYHSSSYCIAELGATWALGKEKLLFHILDEDFSDVHATQITNQSAKFSEKTLCDLFDVLSRKINHNARNTVAQNRKIKEFLEKLTELVNKIPDPEIVSFQKYNKLKEEKIEIEKNASKIDEENEKLKSMVEKLEKAKDKKEVDKIKKEYSDESEQLEDILDKIERFHGKFPKVIREVLFYHFKGEGYPYDEDYEDQIRNSINKNLISYNKESKECAIVEGDNVELDRYIECIGDLSGLLDLDEGGMSESFYDELKDKYGCNPDLSNKKFWDAVI